MKNFEELFEAVENVYNFEGYDELQMYSPMRNSFLFFDGEGFEFNVLVNYHPGCLVNYTYSVRIGEKEIESKSPRKIYNLVKAIIKCED